LVRRFTSLNKTFDVPSFCRVEPYSNAHPLPAVSSFPNFTLSFSTKFLYFDSCIQLCRNTYLSLPCRLSRKRGKYLNALLPKIPRVLLFTRVNLRNLIKMKALRLVILTPPERTLLLLLRLRQMVGKERDRVTKNLRVLLNCLHLLPKKLLTNSQRTSTPLGQPSG
jgi:hypothetical protein